MTKFRYKIQKVLFEFIGNVRWHGLRHPFWLTINAQTFKLKGKHYREVEQIIKPGDILLRRFEGYVDKWLIPGWYNHAGIYVGQLDNKNHQVIHSVSEGVVLEDLIDFSRTDHLIVLRAPARLREKAIERAKKVIGSDYDFAFNFGDSLRFSCTELINYCYANRRWVINGKRRFGVYTIIADDIVNTDHFRTVWTSIKRKDD